MSIFNFSEEQSLGEVRSVETSRITVRVTDGQRLQKARVGRLVAICHERCNSDPHPTPEIRSRG